MSGLSLRQQSLLVKTQEEPGVNLNQSVFTLEIIGDLDKDKLQQSVDLIIARHNVLRLSFIDTNTLSAQSTSPEDYSHLEKAEFLELDLSDEQDRHYSLEKYIESEQLRPFDLSKEWPIRVCLVAMSAEVHVLVVNVHGIVWDEHSQLIFVNELLDFYQSLCLNKELKAAPLSIQYQDYVNWQHDSLIADSFAEKIAWWQQELSELPEFETIIPDKPRKPNSVTTGQSFKQGFESGLFVKLSNLAIKFEVDIAILLNCAFTIFLSRWNSHSDILLGRIVSHRRMPDTSRLIGCFSDVQPLLLHIDEQLSFEQLTQQCHLKIAETDNNLVPFELLLKKLRVRERLQNSTFVQVSFEYKDNSLYEFELPDLKATFSKHNKDVAKFDLSLVVSNGEAGLSLDWIYVDELFAEDTIARMSASFHALLNGLAHEPRKQVVSIPMQVIEDEQLLNHWNANSDNNVNYLSLMGLFENQVELHQDDVALTHNSYSITYKELNHRAEMLAAWLQQSGIGSDGIVVVCIEPGIDSLVALISVFKLGATLLPIEPGICNNNLSLILAETKPEAILTKNCFTSLFTPEHQTLLVCQDDEQFRHFICAKANTELPLTAPLTVNKNGAYLIYVADESGRPIGVIGNPRVLLNSLLWAKRQFPFMPDEVLCLSSSFASFDHLKEAFQALLTGSRLVIAPEDILNNAKAFLAFLIKEKITRVTLAPSLLTEMMQEKDFSRLTHLRYIFSENESISDALAQLCRQKLSSVKLINIYGSAEYGAEFSFNEVGPDTSGDILNYFQGAGGFLAFDDPDLHIGDEANKVMNHPKTYFSETRLAESPWSLEQYLKDLKARVISGKVEVGAQTYIGHMTSALPSFMPEMSKLISQLNQNVVKIETSGSITFLERQVMAKMHRLFYNKAESFYAKNVQDAHHVFGTMTSGGSVSNVTALWCARNKALIKMGVSKEVLVSQGAHSTSESLGYKRGVIIGSRLMHYSMAKTASILGIGEQSIRYVPQHHNQKISPEDLEKCVTQAIENDEYIIAIVGVAGATETGTIDPLINMANIATKYGVHFHVDAAWGGAFQFSEKYRHQFKGIERADSITICPHKQLYLPQGISLCLFKNTDVAKNFSVHANYQSEVGSYDLGQYSIEGSRPANALLLHAGLHLLSKKGYAYLVDKSMERTRYFTHLIEASECFELVGKPEINIVNYRFIPKDLYQHNLRFYSDSENRRIDEATLLIQKQQFLQGKTFVSKTKMTEPQAGSGPIWVFRAVLSNPLTMNHHLREVLQNQLDIANRYICATQVQLASLSDQRFAEKYSEHELSVNETADRNQNIISIGKPIANTQILILGKDMKSVPIGAVGEMFVSGYGLANSYFNAPELTKQKFVDIIDRRNTKRRYYRSGELARWRSDGNIDVIDRKLKGD